MCSVPNYNVSTLWTKQCESCSETRLKLFLKLVGVVEFQED